MRRLTALLSMAPLLSCLLLAACDRSPAPATTQGPASAIDPAEAVRSASQRLAEVRSFHAELDVEGAALAVRSSMDFVAPDRFRLQTASGPQTIIGDTMFLQSAGATRQVPTPAGLLDQWRRPLTGDVPSVPMKAEDLGRQPLDGVDTRHYRLLGAAGERLEYWVDAQGLPRQIVRIGSNHGRPYQLRLRYSRLNDPSLRIDRP
ncbi:LolA family protein [Stenotrophomonas sp. NPDC077659]|uniref:LolA family protein n=1 Tax=Stenotrophomonas sp. NPDC077659 TaxID=3390694 RepID=UPI003D01DEE4